jgi:hypothetical protein
MQGAANGVFPQNVHTLTRVGTRAEFSRQRDSKIPDRPSGLSGKETEISYKMGISQPASEPFNRI